MRQVKRKLPLTMPRHAAIALAVSSICHGWVSAQVLEDVVISASRAEQRSFDAPAAVQSIDRQVIQGAGAQVNLSEALNRVPGLTILNRQNYAQDLQVSIRGFGARSAFGIRGIRLLVDGIPATTPDGQGQGSSISLTSTDRMEVLRGPLAQMYGNSAGGVIQAFTRDAPEAPEVVAQAYGGSFGTRRTDWQYAGRTGAVGVVADYSTFDTQGYRDHSDTERKQFNGKLSFAPSEQTKAHVVFNQFDMPLANDPVGLTAAQVAANPLQAGNNAVSRGVRKEVLQNQLGGALVHALDSDRSVSGRLYIGHRDNIQYQTGLATSTGAWVGLNRHYYGVGLQYNAKTQLGNWPLTWVAGYEFDRSQERRQGGVATLGVKGGVTRDEDNQAESSDLFVQANARVSEQLSVVAGLRNSSVRFLSEDHYFKDGDGSGSTRYRATNPVLGVTYHASDSLNIYANSGRGFESPTLVEVAYSGSGKPAFNTSLNASRSRHYELGAKWSPVPHARLDLAVFQIDSRDEIVVASSAGGSSTYKNAPGTKRTGWELSGAAVLTPQVRLRLAASQIDAKFTQTFTSGSARVDAGNTIPGIPRSFLFSELAWASQGLDVLRNKPARTGTSLGVELIQSGRLYANDANTASADGYTTLNFKASQTWALGAGSLTAYVRIENLTDKRYVGSVIVNQAASQFYEPAPGRNWMLGLRLVLPI